MFEREEEKLGDYKNMFDHIEIQQMLLNDAIMEGFKKAKLEEMRKPSRRKWLFSLTVAAIIFVGFFTSIRLSPAFANFITAIPGMEKIVDLIPNDKGKLSAIENDYFEKIGVSEEKNDLKVTIDGVIADENGLVLFYTTTSKEKQKKLYTENVHLEGLDGKSLEIGTISMGSPLIPEKRETTHSDRLEFYFQSPLEAKRFELKVRVKGKNQKEDFILQIELKKEIQKKKKYVLNKTVTIEGQKISFLKANVYPLRVAVYMKMDLNNSKKLLNFDDLRLVDGNGETWNKVSDGVTASRISDDEAIVYLQSNYFREPKELYLVFNKIQAIDKDQAAVVIDAKNNKILSHQKRIFLVG